MSERHSRTARPYPRLVLANPLQLTLERLHADLLALASGEVATYIPELGRADPEHFGLSIATVDGHVYSVGDCDVEFTIQSISKPFVYGLALDDLGVEAVLAKIGVEPSGEAFNAISLEPGTGRPRNPMINAGAIASAGLVEGGDSQEKFERMLAMLSAYAGRPLDVSESTFRSEKETGHRNRAIGHLLRNAGIIAGDVDEVCDRYFRQCSVLVTSNDLAVMAATLANGGVNPRTGAHAVGAAHVERLLAVMSTCGMYDAAGSWVYRVGMPAKSGVGGGILAVLPGQLGVGVFAPRLDAFGNSVRGVAACEALSREFALHLLRPPVSIDAVVRSSNRLPELRSRRRRTAEEMAVLAREGARVRVVQLQGPLVLSTAEAALRHTLEHAAPGGLVVLDFRRVSGFEPSVAGFLATFAREVARAGGETILTLGDRAAWEGAIRSAMAAAGLESGLRILPDLDAALELCEDALLASTDGGAGNCAEMEFASHPLVRALAAEDAASLEAVAARETFAAGERIVEAGKPADSLYVLAAGLVEISVGGSNGSPHRLATQGRGTAFGELALIDGGPRSADVHALTDVVVYRIPVTAVEGRGEGPRLRLVQALAADLAERLRQANAEIAALAS
jgi:glutaminase